VASAAYAEALCGGEETLSQRSRLQSTAGLETDRGRRKQADIRRSTCMAAPSIIARRSTTEHQSVKGLAIDSRATRPQTERARICSCMTGASI